MLKRLILIAVFLMSSCANEVDDSENILELVKAEGACGVCLTVGAWYRFTKLELKEISGGTEVLVGALSGTWAKDITKNELSILMEVISVDSTQVEFRLVNGARVGASDICRLTDTEVSLIQPFKGVTLPDEMCKEIFGPETVCCKTPNDPVFTSAEKCNKSGYSALPDEMCKEIFGPETVCCKTPNDPVFTSAEKCKYSTLGASQPTKVFVYSGSQAHPKNCNPNFYHSIPVTDVVATTSCSGACSETDAIEDDFLEGEFIGSLTKLGFNSTCTCLELGDKLSDEACGTFSVDYEDTVYDGTCNGCGPAYKALATLVPAFNLKDGVAQELDFTSCEETAGEPAVCVTAGFRAVRIADIPPACE